jgi:nitroreductase
MSVLDPKQLQESLAWRYATKKFDSSKRIPSDVWKALEASLVQSPSSYGLQPYKFIVLTDPKIRDQIKAVSWNQAQVTDCSHYVILAIRKDMGEEWVDKFLARTAEVRGAALESLAGYKKYMMGDIVNGPRSAEVNEWATRQSYIAFGTLMLAAAVMGVDACPIEGMVPAKVDEILGLEAQGLGSVAACALGYRSADDKYATLPKVRFPVETLVEYR